MELTDKKNRKEIRKELISPFILHSKEFWQKWLKEEILEDWSIKFYFEWYASTTEKDWHWEIVEPKGIKLDRYLKNPIIKRGHKRGEENNIWLVTEINIKQNWMYIHWYAILNSEIEWHKEIIHWLKHWLIKWFSIWFWNVEVNYDKKKDAHIITSLELYEISLVDIPSNPLTITKALELYIQKEKEEIEEEEIEVDETIIEEEKQAGNEKELQWDLENTTKKEEKKEEVKLIIDEEEEEEPIEDLEKKVEENIIIKDNKENATSNIWNDTKSENDIEQNKLLSDKLQELEVKNICLEELLTEYSKTVNLLTEQIEEKNAIIEKARKTIIQKQWQVFQKKEEENKPYLFEELKSIQEKYRK